MIYQVNPCWTYINWRLLYVRYIFESVAPSRVLLLGYKNLTNVGSNYHCLVVYHWM